MNQTQQPIDLKQTTGIECQNCGGIFFEEAILLRRLSKIYTATPVDQIVPIPAFTCKDCGSPIKEFFPTGMADVEQKLGLIKVEPDGNKLQF